MSRQSQKIAALPLVVLAIVALVVLLAWAFSSPAHALSLAPSAPMRTLPYYVPDQSAQSF